MERIDRTERLLNLVIALMATQQPLARSAIRQRIPGYEGNDVAFERKFERDKDELRSMGIPIETVVDSGGEVLGYRIVRADYALAELNLTLEERTAVGLAGQAWRGAAAGAVAGRAALKLDGVVGDERVGSSPPVQLTAQEAALLPLMTALRTDRDARFDYQRPAAEETTRRTISPWGLRAAMGAWYVVGFDHDRQELRNFRLSRIRGPVELVGDSRSFSPPADFDVASHAQPTTSISAHVVVQDGGAAALRQHAESMSQDGHLTVHSTDLEALVAEICAAGDSATVVEPPAVVDSVCHALDKVIEAHRDHA
jgi:proteasome accessory factor B